MLPPLDVAFAKRIVSATKAPSYSRAISSTTATDVVRGRRAPSDEKRSKLCSESHCVAAADSRRMTGVMTSWPWFHDATSASEMYDTRATMEPPRSATSFRTQLKVCGRPW